MNQIEQLKREGNLLAKPVRPKKPKKGLRRASPKRAQQMKEYLKLRGAFLKHNQWCEALVFGIGCKHRARDIHHIKGRIGQMLLDQNYWLPVCRTCHDWIHSHAQSARELGLLQ